MRDKIFQFVAGVVKKKNLSTGRILDVGSRDINGTVRPLFTGEYIGLDMQEGENVDVLFWGEKALSVDIQP